jgi:hypothetical protein
MTKFTKKLYKHTKTSNCQKTYTRGGKRGNVKSVNIAVVSNISRNSVDNSASVVMITSDARRY